MAREPETITELRRALGAQLATFRLAAELTQGQLARVAICDRTTLVHIEKGRARADERFWRAVDDACDARGALLAAYMELEATKVEHEQREREKRLATVRAMAAELRGQPSLIGSHTPVIGAERGGLPILDDLRHALLGHQTQLDGGQDTAPTGAMQVEASVVQVHRLYQMADYDGAAQQLPLVVRRLGTDNSLPAKVTAYLAAAKLATKLGDTALAWVAADRSLRLATETERQALIGIANYQVACALLGSGHIADAERTAVSAAEHIASGTTKQAAEEMLSARGALLLLLAIMAARRGDAPVAQRYLHDASELAHRLGQDGNWLWTAFGPTNIAIHELAVQVALGDSRKALHLGETIDTDGLPTVLRGRRSQVHLELGWASVGQGDDSLAVLHLLEAERVAKQTVSRNATARALLTTLLNRERKSATPGLRSLASRAGVLQ